MLEDALPLIKPKGKLCFCPGEPVTGQKNPATLSVLSAFYRTIPPTSLLLPKLILWPGPHLPSYTGAYTPTAEPTSTALTATGLHGNQ